TIAYLLRHALNAAVVREHPVGRDGEPVDLKVLRARLKDGEPIDDVLLPPGACGVDILQFFDPLPLEMVHRHAASHGQGVVLAGLDDIDEDERDLLRTVLGRLDETEHAYPDRKIKRLAVAFLDGDHTGTASLLHKGKLTAEPLEKHGDGLV